MYFDYFMVVYVFWGIFGEDMVWELSNACCALFLVGLSHLFRLVLKHVIQIFFLQEAGIKQQKFQCPEPTSESSMKTYSSHMNNAFYVNIMKIFYYCHYDFALHLNGYEKSRVGELKMI